MVSDFASMQVCLLCSCTFTHRWEFHYEYLLRFAEEEFETMDKNLFGLLCFVNFIIIAICQPDEFKEYKAVRIHKKVLVVFTKTIDMKLFSNGKKMENPFGKIENYEIYATSRLDDFIELSVEVLRDFDRNLITKRWEVIFLSFYYKMLRWLSYHLSKIQNDKQVFNPGLNNLIDEIIKKREFSEDIVAAFSTKIYQLKTPLDLKNSFGQEIDYAIRLIHEIENRSAEVQVDPKLIIDGKGREKFDELEMSGTDDYTSYEANCRPLELIGVIDIVAIRFGGGYKREIDYDAIDLSKYSRGTVGYFKNASLLFIQATEKSVLHLVDKLNDNTYEYQKAFIENFSTRDKAFHLRFCGLNAQVSLAVNYLGNTYIYNLYGKTNGEEIRNAFYRFLKWLSEVSKYAKTRTCSYTEDKINEIFPLIQKYAPVPDDILEASIPHGINTVKELMEFGQYGKIEGKPFSEEDGDNDKVFVPEEEPLDNVGDPSDEKIDDSWSDDPSDIEDVEIIRVHENPSGGIAQSTKNLIQSPSLANFKSWISSVASFIGLG